MAKSQLTKTRVITDKVSVKGTLSEDCTTITYLDEAKMEQEITVANCLKMFAGMSVDFNVSVKSEGELTDDEE